MLHGPLHPGLLLFYPEPADLQNLDSHAHILEYGFTRLLPMEGTATAKGKFEEVVIPYVPEVACNPNHLVYRNGPAR